MEENTSVELSLEELVQDDAAPETPETTEPPKKEPGWIKKRVETAVQKQLAEMETRLRDEYEQKFAPLREAALERDADKLVSDGEFKSRDRALEYLRLKGGMPEPAKPLEKPRDEQGRFVADENIKVRSAQLAAQAETIRETMGVDVMEMFNQDPAIQKKVLSGEWNFLDVIRETGRQRIPTPTRSANNGSLGDVSIARMSRAQFQKLQESISKGGVVDLRK